MNRGVFGSCEFQRLTTFLEIPRRLYTSDVMFHIARIAYVHYSLEIQLAGGNNNTLYTTAGVVLSIVRCRTSVVICERSFKRLRNCSVIL